MSHDPALEPTSSLCYYPRLQESELNEGSVYAFDFDGVISSSLEDRVYKLQPEAYESELFEAARQAFKVKCEGMEHRYQRHLLFQAAAYHLNIPISPGPDISIARNAASISKLFILTARSGWYAVERMRNFIYENSLNPVEIYNVGRVPKHLQIELLSREFKEHAVFYIEDSQAHLNNVYEKGLKNVQLRLSENAPVESDRNVRVIYYQVMTNALGISMKGQIDDMFE